MRTWYSILKHDIKMETHQILEEINIQAMIEFTHVWIHSSQEHVNLIIKKYHLNKQIKTYFMPNLST